MSEETAHQSPASREASFPDKSVNERAIDLDKPRPRIVVRAVANPDKHANASLGICKASPEAGKERTGLNESGSFKIN